MHVYAREDYGKDVCVGGGREEGAVEIDRTLEETERNVNIMKECKADVHH